MFFLGGLGLTVSQDRRKWIFFLTIIFIWLINFPRNTFSIGLIGHLLNALTNPFKSMVTSYQMATNSCFWYLLMPLVALGIGVIKEMAQGKVEYKRLTWFVVFMAIFAVNGCSYQPAVVKTYILLAMTISLIALGVLILGARNLSLRRIAVGALIFLFLMDVIISAIVMKSYLAYGCPLRPHNVEALPSPIGPVGLDFHNPKIFPFVARSDIYPVVDQSFLWTLRDMSLNFNSVINRQTAFMPIENHSPRHISFQGWANDPAMRQYIAQNDRLFYFASCAVQQGPGVFENIVANQLSRDVMMVEGNEPTIKADIPPRIADFKGEDQWISIPEDIRDSSPGWIYKDGMAIWEFPIQGKIPEYYATNIFTHDRWVRFFIQSADQKYIELTPVQGQLLRPMTFDVQNIKEGKVFVALPVNTSLVGLKGVLLLKVRDASGITSVWLHHSDDTGITFRAPADGWLGIEYPYDPKWRIDVDGKAAHFYRANKSFMGLPVTQGEHKILIRYWPDSWLRWGLPLSVIISSILFIFLIFYALYENK